MSSPEGGPRAEYARRLEARRARAVEMRKADERVGTAGLWCASAIGVILVLALLKIVPPAWILPPLAGLVVLRLVHVRLEARRRPFEFGIRFYEQGLERVEDRWIGKGRRGEAFQDPDHPYAADLDLFGRGSLFERLCTTGTRSGERVLAGWLLKGSSTSDLRERQRAVGELRDRLDLREELAMLAGEVEHEVDPDSLRAWAQAPPEKDGTALRVMAFLVPALALGALVGGLVFKWGAWPFLGSVVVLLTASRLTTPRVRRVTGPAQQAERELVVLARVLDRLERETFLAPRLAALQGSLRGAGAAIRRLANTVQLLLSARNELFAALAGLLLWRLHVTLALERWRAAHGPSIAAWIDAAGELDALSALGAYAWENPGDPFPELVDDGVVYEATALGHPLLPLRTVVRNDVRLGAAPAVLIVSGSNMSGKSTLLRAVGANLVLAFSGAPVRASSMRLSPLVPGATIRVQDSLQEGTSRFFAEVKRLRQLMDLAAGPRRLLFLLEELLSGTNSADRQTGAEILVRELVQRGAIGLVTTHDLALAAAADALGARAANVHFEDQILDGKLTFDYTLRPGPVQKSNALALMRAVGLPV